MKNILPSKKFRKVFGGILLAIALIFIIGIVFNRKTTFQTAKKDAQILVVDQLVEKDTDGDGLKDWEEPIWGMDLNKADTDGNGISDLEEVKKKQATLKEQNPDQDTIEKTRTGQFTEEVVKIVSVLQSTNQLGSENQDQIASQIAEYIEKNNVHKVYTVLDFDSKLGDKKDIDKYLLLLNQIILNSSLSEKELTLAWDYENTIDTNALGELKLVSQRLKKQEELLAKTIPPEQLLDIHVQYINSVSNIANLYDGLYQYETDPLVALSSYNTLESVFLEQKNLIDIMITRIKQLSQ